MWWKLHGFIFNLPEKPSESLIEQSEYLA